MTGQALRADRPDRRAEGGEAFQARGVGAQLARADSSVVARIEGQHDRFAALLRQGVLRVDTLAASQSDAGEREVGRNLADFRCLSHSASSWRLLLLLPSTAPLHRVCGG